MKQEQYVKDARRKLHKKASEIIKELEDLAEAEDMSVEWIMEVFQEILHQKIKKFVQE